MRSGSDRIILFYPLMSDKYCLMITLYPREVRQGFEYSILPSVAKYSPETLFSDSLNKGNLASQSLLAADTGATAYLKATKVRDYEYGNVGKVLLIEFPQPFFESELFYAASFLAYADIRDSDELSCPYYFLAKADDERCIFGEVVETEDGFEPIVYDNLRRAVISDFVESVWCKIKSKKV